NAPPAAESAPLSLHDALPIYTNMHGFRMTDYLDGIVVANFIDDDKVDYIATDRQNLRWDAPKLAAMRQFLSAEIKSAVKECQRTDRKSTRLNSSHVKISYAVF